MTSAPSNGAGCGWRGIFMLFSDQILAIRVLVELVLTQCSCMVMAAAKEIGRWLWRKGARLGRRPLQRHAVWRKEGWARHSLLRGLFRLIGLVQLPLFQNLLDAFHVLLRKIQGEMQIRDSAQLQPLHQFMLDVSRRMLQCLDRVGLLP